MSFGKPCCTASNIKPTLLIDQCQTKSGDANSPQSVAHFEANMPSSSIWAFSKKHLLRHEARDHWLVDEWTQCTHLLCKDGKPGPDDDDSDSYVNQEQVEACTENLQQSFPNTKPGRVGLLFTSVDVCLRVCCSVVTGDEAFHAPHLKKEGRLLFIKMLCVCVCDFCVKKRPALVK